MLRNIMLVATVVLGSVAGSGCASSGGIPSADRAVRTAGAGSWLTAKDLRPYRSRDALTALRMLRPNLLHDRGQTSILLATPRMPEVYVDGMYFGPLQSLRDLPVGEVAAIRFLSTGDAVLRYGAQRAAGVIEVLTVH